MTLRTTAAVAAGVIALTVGALDALAPKTPEELDRHVQQQQVEQASDAQERERERFRDDADAAADADRRDRLRPGEHRPPEKPPIRIRIR